MRGGGCRRQLAVVVASAALTLGLSVGASDAGAQSSGFGSNWTVYHQNLLSTGVDPAGTNLDTISPGWDSPVLDAGIYTEPLVDDGRVVVATENDTVYALSANNGSILWSTHLGTPINVKEIPCPSVVSPIVGITGTPFIDPVTNEIFVVAMEHTPQGVEHRLYGLNLFTGSIDLDQDADPPGSKPLQLLQRTGLTASQGNVVVSYTGFGDCGDYHGWVLGIPEQGGRMLTFEVDAGRGEKMGGVWMGGAAPLVDSAGDIWFGTANGSVTKPTHPYDQGNAIVELTPGFRRKQIFGDPIWWLDNAEDLDLGSTNPVLVNGFAFIVSKAGEAYLARQTHLGGVGGQVATSALCQPARHGGSAWGGSDVDGTVVYVNCATGEPGNAQFSHTTAVQIARRPPYLHVLWRATSHGSAGPPIVAGGKVWTITLDGTLLGLSQTTGAIEVQEHIGINGNHFPTPAVADGLLLVPALDRILAFDGPAGIPPAPAPAPAP